MASPRVAPAVARRCRQRITVPRRGSRLCFEFWHVCDADEAASLLPPIVRRSVLVRFAWGTRFLIDLSSICVLVRRAQTSVDTKRLTCYIGLIIMHR